MFHQKLKYSTLFIITVLFSSCLPGNGTKTGKAFETYYVGDGLNQYFVAPLKFKSGEMSFQCDFTYRDKNDSVTCNFSIFADKPFVNFDYVGFKVKSERINLDRAKKLFVEKQKNKFHSRYTSKITVTSFIKLFHLNELIPEFKSGSTKEEFEAKGTSKKAIGRVKSNLISILELEN